MFRRKSQIWWVQLVNPWRHNPKANESSKAEKPLDQVYDSLNEKICDGMKMSKNMYWSTYVDFKTGKKVDIEADIVYCYNYQQSKEVLEDSEEL